MGRTREPGCTRTTITHSTNIARHRTTRRSSLRICIQDLLQHVHGRKSLAADSLRIPGV